MVLNSKNVTHELMKFNYILFSYFVLRDNHNHLQIPRTDYSYHQPQEPSLQKSYVNEMTTTKYC